MDPFEMEQPPKKKSFWMLPFAVHATRGIIRDQNTRRWTMFGTLLIALLLLFVGSTFWIQSCAYIPFGSSYFGSLLPG
jgi:hypothetical protein